MTQRSLSLAVVGADWPNRAGPPRRFEIAMCEPGEPVDLVPEPDNPADRRAVAVYSTRGVQIGYLTAERAPWIGANLRNGRTVTAIFQRRTEWGAVIRAAFDSADPTLPESVSPDLTKDQDFWPDYFPPDE